MQNKAGKPVAVLSAEYCLKVQVLHICGLTLFLFLAPVPKPEWKLCRVMPWLWWALHCCQQIKVMFKGLILVAYSPFFSLIWQTRGLAELAESLGWSSAFCCHWRISFNWGIARWTKAHECVYMWYMYLLVSGTNFTSGAENLQRNLFSLCPYALKIQLECLIGVPQTWKRPHFTRAELIFVSIFTAWELLLFFFIEVFSAKCVPDINLHSHQGDTT